jgi:hypothetical protein
MKEYEVDRMDGINQPLKIGSAVTYLRPHVRCIAPGIVHHFTQKSVSVIQLPAAVELLGRKFIALEKPLSRDPMIVTRISTRSIIRCFDLCKHRSIFAFTCMKLKEGVAQDKILDMIMNDRNSGLDYSQYNIANFDAGRSAFDWGTERWAVPHNWQLTAAEDEFWAAVNWWDDIGSQEAKYEL